MTRKECRSPLAALDEGAAVLVIALRAIELTALAVTSRPVPLDIPQMRAGGAAPQLVADDPRLHHYPPLPVAGTSLRRLPLQPVGHGLAPPDPRAPSLPGRGPATLTGGNMRMGERTAIRLGRRFHHLVDEGP